MQRKVKRREGFTRCPCNGTALLPTGKVCDEKLPAVFSYPLEEARKGSLAARLQNLGRQALEDHPGGLPSG